jgi:murein DD-endopeptidase MepM/ murein hydrolase activator NlpD
LHAGGFVIRYGEVQPSLAAGLSKGSRVKMGQAIGAIKKTVCCTPMLHFETYTGSSTGPLSVIGVNRFNRRADIIDGTPHLRKWRRSL